MAAEIKRVFDLLKYSLENPKQEFISGKINGKWINYSTADFCTAVDNLSRGLIKQGIGKGGRVAVMSHNRPEWNIADFAANQIGAYQIPLYPTLAEHDIQFILKDAEIAIIFVADEDLYKKIKPCADAINPAIKIYSFNEIKEAENWNTLIELGKASTDIDLEEYRAKVAPEDVLTLIYTSGTTGTPQSMLVCNI